MIIMSNPKKQMATMEYTFNMLLNDILELPKENEDKGDSNDKAGRELQSKLIIMQMLIGQADKYKADAFNDEEGLRNALEVEVNGDELLSGYAFFVPQNPQFDYTWSYMRKRKKSYIEFLVKAVMFLRNVLSDINILASKSRGSENVRLVFNDIFDVSFIAEIPHVKIGVQWENFYRLATIKKSYNVVVKAGEVVLLARDRKKAQDINDIIDVALQMVSNAI